MRDTITAHVEKLSMQLTFGDADALGNQTRREISLTEMEQVVPWSALQIQIEPHYPRSARTQTRLVIRRCTRPARSASGTSVRRRRTSGWGVFRGWCTTWSARGQCQRCRRHPRAATWQGRLRRCWHCLRCPMDGASAVIAGIAANPAQGARKGH